MNLYFAPLEGVTTYTYRNTHAKLFGGCDTYYAPFITPSDIEKISIKNLRDILPDKNHVNLKIQVLTSKSESYFRASKVSDQGINLSSPYLLFHSTFISLIYLSAVETLILISLEHSLAATVKLTLGFVTKYL